MHAFNILNKLRLTTLISAEHFEAVDGGVVVADQRTMMTTVLVEPADAEVSGKSRKTCVSS